MIDDGEGLQETTLLIGRAFISALGEFDRVGALTADSPIKDLGLVMSLYLEWSGSIEDCDAGEFDWREEVLGYARKAGIDLKATGCYGVAATLKALDDEFGEVDPIESSTTADRWGWKKAVSVPHISTNTKWVTHLPHR